MLSPTDMKWPVGPMVRRLATKKELSCSHRSKLALVNQEILGSSPRLVAFFFFGAVFYFLLICNYEV